VPSASEWLSPVPANAAGEGTKKATPEFDRYVQASSRKHKMPKPSDGTNGLSKSSWQRSRNKLMDSPKSASSPKRATTPKGGDASPPSLSPASRRSRYSTVDPLSPEHDPFHIQETVQPRTTKPETWFMGGFEARVNALQQKVRVNFPADSAERTLTQPCRGDRLLREASPVRAAVPSFGSPSPEQEPSNFLRDPRLTASPGTAHSDETLASRVGQLEDSLGRIELMLQQVLQGMAVGAGGGAAGQSLSGAASPARSQSKQLPRMPSRASSKALSTASDLMDETALLPLGPSSSQVKPSKQIKRAVATPDAAAGASTELSDVGPDEARTLREEELQDDKRKPSKSEAVKTPETRKGFFKWPLDITEAREELGLPKPRRSQA